MAFAPVVLIFSGEGREEDSASHVHAFIPVLCGKNVARSPVCANLCSSSLRCRRVFGALYRDQARVPRARHELVLALKLDHHVRRRHLERCGGAALLDVGYPVEPQVVPSWHGFR